MDGPASKVMDAAFIGAALFFNSLTAPMVKATQNDEGSYSYRKECIYFFAELLKFAVAVGWCVWKWQTEPSLRPKLRFSRRDFWQYSIPGFVFFAQNNLSFLALQHMSPSAFQLLLNTRIISVAVLAVVFLGKKLNAVEWISIVLLTNGAAAYQLSDCTGESDMKVSTEGLMIMFVIIMCAAGGNIATQKLMQKGDQPLMLQNAILYLWGIGFNLFNLVMSMRSSPEMGWLGKVEGIQVTSIIFNAVYGLSISIILKRFGAITRTFINTVAIVCTAFIDYSIWSDSITYLQMTTFATIFCAVFLHSIIAKDYKPGQVAVSEPATSTDTKHDRARSMESGGDVLAQPMVLRSGRKKQIATAEAGAGSDDTDALLEKAKKILDE